MLVFILNYFSSKEDSYIKFGSKYKYNIKDNFHLKIKYSGPGNDAFLYYVESSSLNNPQHIIVCDYSKTDACTTVGAKIYTFKEQNLNRDFYFQISGAQFDDSGKGMLVMHSLKEEIKIKLRNKYENPKYSLCENDILNTEISLLPKIGYITYSGPNLERDVNIIFQYKENCCGFSID